MMTKIIDRRNPKIVRRRAAPHEVHDGNQILYSAIRVDFRTFVAMVFQTVTGKQLSDDPYVDLICHEVLCVYEGKTQRLVLSLPPRHGKTLMCSVALACWELAHRPHAQLLLLAYSKKNSRDTAEHVHTVLTSRWFRKCFPE